MQRTWATRSDLARSVVQHREAVLAQYREDRHPVPICLSVFGLCALAPLSLLFGLDGRFHHGTRLLLQVVVVVVFGEVPALAFPVPANDS